MSRHTWEYPIYCENYMSALEGANPPHWEVLEELPLRGSFTGAGHAWIVKDTANGVVALQSYRTIVSIYAGGGKVMHLGKWTPTTSRQQSRFDLYMAEHGARFEQ